MGAVQWKLPFPTSIGAKAVAKPELGIKRLCGSCGAKFYDLARSPIICPKCGTTYEVAAPTRASRQAPVAAAAPVPAEEETPQPVGAEVISLEEAAEAESKATKSVKGAPPDADGEEDEVEVAAGEDDTFLEEEEEEAGNVTDLIGDGIEQKEEET
jgi:uncharacterized protein (TIGR02300 family)